MTRSLVRPVGAVLLAACFAASPTVAQPAATAAAPAPEAELLLAEDRMFQAKVAHDAAGIARGLADEVTYTHATGRVQGKADYVKSIAEGRFSYRSIQAADRTARVSGDLGVTHGTLQVAMGDRTMQDTYLASYVRRDGHWQLLFWQTSPDANAAPSPSLRSGAPGTGSPAPGGR